MTLAHTILTVLMESDQSGYDLSKRFEESVSCFWKASQQQIYRELNKIEKLGWVEHESIAQVGKPNKKLYRITKSGKEELNHWFSAPTSPTPVREDLLVKVLAGPYMPPETLVSQIEERRSLHQAQLDCYLEKEKLFQQLEEPAKALQFQYLTLRRGIRYEADWVNWCDEVLDIIQNQN